MRIENLRTERHNQRYAVAATVIWEDCDQPQRDIYLNVDEAFAPYLTLDPHTFLVAGLVPAMQYGERRIAIDAKICPELRNGLLMNMQWLREWYGPPCQLVRLETKPGIRSPRLGKEERVGSFLSGRTGFSRELCGQTVWTFLWIIRDPSKIVS